MVVGSKLLGAPLPVNILSPTHTYVHILLDSPFSQSLLAALTLTDALPLPLTF